MMINLLLSFLMLLPTQPLSCEEQFDRFIAANSVLESPIADQAFLLQLSVQTIFAKPQNNRKDITQEVVAIIHDEGFCIKTDEMINIGENGELYVIMPSAHTLIQTAYNPNELPDLLQVMDHQRQIIKNAEHRSCELIRQGDQEYYRLTASFAEPLKMQQQWVTEVIFDVNVDSYVLQQVSLHFAPNQSVEKQIIRYLQFDRNHNKKNALTKASIFRVDGQLKKEFAHFEIIKP